MGHGQGMDKGHEQGKSNNGPEKGQDKGQGKAKKHKGQGQEKGEGESFQGQEQAKGKSRGSSEGKGLSPSPWTGGGEEAKGDKKGQKAKGEGKPPKTAEQVKQHSTPTWIRKATECHITIRGGMWPLARCTRSPMDSFHSGKGRGRPRAPCSATPSGNS